MGPLAKFLRPFGVNVAPLLGVFLDDWSIATALVFYWTETLIACGLTVVRVAVHRKLTHKRGHYRVRSRQGRRQGGERRPDQFSRGGFLAAFTVSSLVLIGAQGLFLVLLLTAILPAEVDMPGVREGVVIMSAILLVGLLVDLSKMPSRSFALVKESAEGVLARTALIHLTILGGMLLISLVDQPPVFFGVFAVMKTVADLFDVIPLNGIRLHGIPQRKGGLPALTAPMEPPAWAAKMHARIEPGGDPRKSWQRHLEREAADAEADEEEFTPPASWS